KGVYHLKDGTTLSGADSTSLGNTLAVNSATANSGLIDGAASAGIGQSLGRGSTTHNSAIATVSAWIKATTATGRIAGLDQNGSTHSQEIAIDGSNKAVAYAYDTFNGQRISTGATSVTTGTWHYIVGTWDGTTGRVYLDGSLDGSIGGCTSIFAGYTSPNMEIGGHSTNGPAPTDAYFSGSIDEVRLSHIARSADWIKTEYNNQSLPGTFITMGSESCGTPTPTPTPTATPTPTPTATPTPTPPPPTPTPTATTTPTPTATYTPTPTATPSATPSTTATFTPTPTATATATATYTPTPTATPTPTPTPTSTPCSAPTAPSNLTATAVTNRRIRLNWVDNSSNETGFKIERSTDNVTFAPIAVVGAGVTTYLNAQLVACTRYYYRVRSYLTCNNTDFNSAYSNVANATTTGCPTPTP